MSSSLHFATRTSTKSHISISFRLKSLRKVEQEFRSLTYDTILSSAAGREVQRYLKEKSRRKYLKDQKYWERPLSKLDKGRGPDKNPTRRPPLSRLVVSRTPESTDVVIGGSVTTPATVHYERLIGVRRQGYREGSARQKVAIRDSIINRFSSTGRFMKHYNEGQEFYIELWDRNVIEKVERDLRAKTTVADHIRNFFKR